MLDNARSCISKADSNVDICNFKLFIVCNSCSVTRLLGFVRSVSGTSTGIGKRVSEEGVVECWWSVVGEGELLD